MSALSNKTRNENFDTTYLSVVNGKLALKQTAPGEGIAEHVKKDGAKAYYKLFDQIEEVNLIGCFINDGNFGKQLQILLFSDAEKHKYCIQVDVSSGYAVTFLNKLPNIDFMQPVTLATHFFKNEKGYKTYAISVKQNGAKIEKGFNEDEVPKLVPFKGKGGKTEYSDGDRVEFFENVLVSEIQPKLKQVYKHFINPEN